MRIALIGHGRMGKEIEALAGERGVTVQHIFTGSNNRSGSGLTKAALEGVDVCIDFSSAASVLDSARAIAGAGVDLVIGTTGWERDLDAVRSAVSAGGIGCVHASNFSPGVNVMMRIVKEAGRLFDRHSDYDVAIHEVHHRGKADSPSGTALTLASELLGVIRRKTGVQSGDPDGPVKPELLHVSSSRVGAVAGVHSVRFDSPFDSVEIVHTARSRRGFAAGALSAAEWVRGKKGFFTMNDFMSSLQAGK